MERKIWTPGGEVTVGDEKGAQPEGTPSGPQPGHARGPAMEPSEEEMMRAALAQARAVPTQALVATLLVDLYVKAGMDLEPDEEDASLALAAIEGMLRRVGNRLGEAGEQLDGIRSQDGVEYVIQRAIALYEKASLHLAPGELADSSLAIDALAGLLDAVGEKLGEAGTELGRVLQQLQMHFVQVAEHEKKMGAGSPAPGPTSD